MIIHTHDYDSGYYPAMPIMEIQVRRREGQIPITLQAIVDSGADATMLPLRYLRQLKARKGRTSTDWHKSFSLLAALLPLG